MASVKISDMSKAVQLVRKVMKAADVDKNNTTDESELSRIRIRDGYATRDVIRRARSNAGHDLSIDGAVAALEAAVVSAKRADGKGDRDATLDPAEAAKASKLAQSLARFTGANGRKKLDDFKVTPYERPGTPEFVALAKRDYQNLVRYGGIDFAGTGVRLSELPAAARAKVSALASVHSGRLDIARQKLNGATVYMAHVVTGRRADVLIVDPRGRTIASGLATEKSGKWSVRWS